MPFLAFIIAIVFVVSSPAYAETAPTKADIDKLEAKIKDGKASKKELQSALKNIDKELQGTKSTLVSTAKSIQKNEKNLQNLDIKISNLEKEQKELNEKLQSDRGSIARLILALERIRRLPPEALIAKPEAPLKTAQSAMLMEEILPALNQQANDLKETLERLEIVSADLKAKRSEVADRVQTLENEQKQLKTLVSKRTKLYTSTQKDLEKKKKRIATISSQAKDLKDLVTRLDEDKKKAKKTRKVVTAQPPKAGAPRLPLPGIITTGYNEPDNFGAPSQGIDIEGRAGALVVAPMGGIVQFAGYFKNYGNMVILEHEKGWHSLIAGLENIDTVVGQSIAAGEPLGVLHKSSSGQKPVLYYELRHKGKAVNPAKKFKNLS